jgi:predicted aldo/keto reductase-like oxidoreductase
MQYRNDPKSGNELSLLGFGLMRLPRTLTQQIDIDKTEAMVRMAVEQGVNYFDTAYVYGGSEEAFGKVLARTGLRDRLYLATKLPHAQCKRYEDFDRIFSTQLERLGTDHIDYYLIHNLPDTTLWQRLVDLGIERWIAQKQVDGQIGSLGFSFHGKQPDFLQLLDVHDWDFCQIQYNYLDENYQAGHAGLEAAAAKGLPVIIMEPLRGGKLATGLPKKAEQLFKAADSRASIASWGFRWVFDQPEATVTLSGMGSIEQLEDNLRTAADALPGALNPEQRALYEQVQDIVRESYRVDCTGCNYCMPCPSGVNIPGCFAAWNTRASQGLVAGYTQYITSTGANHAGRYSGPRQCVQCGACERKCPQHIAIMERLQEVNKEMEPFWFTGLLKIIQRFSS